MNTIQFHKALYPKKVITACIHDYAPHFHAEQKEDGDYIVFVYPHEEKKIALEFANYVLAGVRAHANR